MKVEKTKLRDRVWVWGHNTDCLFGQYGIKRHCYYSPVEGTAYLGAKNLVLDIMDMPIVPEEELTKADHIAKVGWSIMDAAAHPENVTNLVEYAKTHKNLDRGIFDDFLCPGNKDTNYTNYPTKMLSGYRQLLHAAGLEMWMVLYTENFRQIDMDVIREYVAEFDGVSLWFWNEQEVLEGFDAYVDTFFNLTEGKKRMIGCYLFDFGSEKEATAPAVIYQLNKEREMLQQGLIEGIVLHGNAALAEEPYAAAEAAKAWMEQHGDEIIG